MKSLLAREPVAVTAAVELLIKAIAALGMAFGWWSWSDDQTAAILLVESAVFGIVFLFVRGSVTPSTTTGGGG